MRKRERGASDGGNVERPDISSSTDRKPAIVTPVKGRAGNDNRAAADVPKSGQTGRSTIVRAEPKRRSAFGDAPDLTPEEHPRRGDAADALWRELVRCAAGDE